MALKLYNTLTRKKEVFKPIRAKEIRMYVCGPTVYGPGHLGHAKTYSTFDTLRKYLEWSDYKVKYMVNITDIHDDVIKEANKRKIDSKKLANQFTKLFFEDIKKLNIKLATIHPRVTEYIPQIIGFIKKLQKNNRTYLLQQKLRGQRWLPNIKQSISNKKICILSTQKHKHPKWKRYNILYIGSIWYALCSTKIKNEIHTNQD